MKKYYIDKSIAYCYPYSINQSLKEDEYGVLGPYIGNMYSRTAMDSIICEMIMNHPYVDGAMRLKVNIMCYDEKKHRTSFYHMLVFQNYEYGEQERSSMKICYRDLVDSERK